MLRNRWPESIGALGRNPSDWVAGISGISNKKDVDLNRLREEVEYKNTQLASKDMEMESYKKVTDEKISQLDVKVKELEGKVGLPPVTP